MERAWTRRALLIFLSLPNFSISSICSLLRYRSGFDAEQEEKRKRERERDNSRENVLGRVDIFIGGYRNRYF